MSDFTITIPIPSDAEVRLMLILLAFTVIWLLGATGVASRVFYGFIRARRAERAEPEIDWSPDWNLVDEPPNRVSEMSRSELERDYYLSKESEQAKQAQLNIANGERADIAVQLAAAEIEIARLTRVKNRHWRTIKRLKRSTQWLTEA